MSDNFFDAVDEENFFDTMDSAGVPQAAATSQGQPSPTDFVDPTSRTPVPMRQALRVTPPSGTSAYEAYLRGGSLEAVTPQEIEALRETIRNEAARGSNETRRRLGMLRAQQEAGTPVSTGGRFFGALAQPGGPAAAPLGRMEIRQEVEPYEADALRRTGEFGQIKFGGLPIADVAKLGLGRNLEESSRGLVEQLFGPEAAKTVKIIQPEGRKADFRGQPTETLQPYAVFKRSPDAPYETVFDPRQPTAAGMAASAIESAPSTVAGMVGGIAGSAASPIIGTAVGTGLAVTIADYARLVAGQRAGTVPSDVSDLDLLKQAASRGGLDALFAAGGQLVLGAILRSVRGGVPDIGMAAQEIEALIRSGQVVLRGAERAAGLPAGTLQTTTGALVGASPRGRVIQEMESQLAKTGGEAGVTLREAEERVRAGKEALQTAPNVLGSEFETTTLLGTRMSPTQLGERVRQIAPGSPDEVAIRMQRMARGRPANPQYGPAQPFIDPTDPAAGQSVASALEMAEEAAKVRSTDAMVRVRNAVNPKARGAARDAQQTALDEEARGQLNRIAGLDQADQKIITQFLNDINDRGLQYTYDEFASTLSSLRRAIRKASGAQQGMDTPNVVTLMRLEEALTRDRNALVRQRAGQGAVDQLLDAEAGYRQIIDGFRRTKLNQFLGTTARGADIVGDESIGARILGNAETASLVSNVVNTQNFPLEREQIRSMLRFELAREGGYLREALGSARRSAERGIDEQKFLKYIDDKRPILRQFFSDSEISQLRGIGEWSGRMRRLFGVDDLKNMGDWFEKFWTNADSRQAAELMNRLNRYDRNNPGENITDTVRAYVRNRLARDITNPPDRSGYMPMIDKDKLFGLLQDKPQRIEWLNSVIDPGFANRFRVVEQALRQLEPPPSGVVLKETERAGRKELSKLQETKVIVLGTLNRLAAFANRQINKALPGAQQAFARAMVDPDFFLSLVQAGERTAGKTSAAQALAIGVNEYTNAAEEARRIGRVATEAGRSAVNMVTPNQP